MPIPPVPGPPSSVLTAILAGGAATQPGGRATFSTTGYPVLPSMMTEVVWLPQFAQLNADVEVVGTLISQGWAAGNVSSVTSAYTPQPSDAVILASAASAPFTVTLPDATQSGFFPGQRFTIIKTDGSANTVTLGTSAGQLINGSSSQSLTTANAFISVVFDGVNSNNWWIWAASATASAPSPPVALTVSAGTAPAIEVNVSGNTTQQLTITGNGTHQWSSGTASADATLSRAGAGVLATGSATSLTVGAHALGVVQPVEYGMATWAFDPAQVSGNLGVTNGTVYLIGQYVNQVTTISKVYWSAAIAAGSAVASQNWAGLYNSSGTLLGSASLDSQVTSGPATHIGTLTSSVAVSPGLYWAGFVFNSGTATVVSMGRGQSVGSGINNINLSNSALRFATNGTGMSTLPSTITPSSNSALQPAVWAGIGT